MTPREILSKYSQRCIQVGATVDFGEHDFNVVPWTIGVSTAAIVATYMHGAY